MKKCTLRKNCRRIGKLFIEYTDISFIIVYETTEGKAAAFIAAAGIIQNLSTIGYGAPKISDEGE